MPTRVFFPHFPVVKSNVGRLHLQASELRKRVVDGKK